MASFARSRVAAVLGPTNTGKTYLAIERMLGHASGVIGFPLRLLARENYDRVVKLKGAGQVALVTGEEKILPPGARYFLCTVEAMPLDRPFAFLAIDEIQLCADAERGHVFTDRLLHARGSEETMFLGAETIRPILAKLVPEAEVITRPRFSTLSWVGPRKLTRLPPRSAVVAFSAAEVYAIAEQVRRQRGGTAVVLGALSPRTRNAQVDMFEAGEVDYLVATDAIGMGLNLDLDHVAFAKLAKFDGQSVRRLAAPEIAQIAGRAGRHMADGTFGTTGEAGTLPPPVIDAVENHRFEPLRHLFWRTRDLDFRSPRQLLRSLERRPPSPLLVRAREADDLTALAVLARAPEVERLATNRAAVRLLWDVCQIPDFQKILSDQHAALLGRIYGFLRTRSGRLPEDWVARQIARIDRAEGDIDALIARIAHVRTWTYISHRAEWLRDAPHWQERTRAIEDRLSDALHERLTQRFVDKRAALLVRRLRAGDALMAGLKADGSVVVEGESVGRLQGFRFQMDADVEREDAKPVLTAARRVLIAEMPGRLRQLESDPESAFALDAEGRVLWNGTAIARLAAGEHPLHPQVEPFASEFLDGPARERVRQRLSAWLDGHLQSGLGPLYALERALEAGALSGPARGIAYQLGEGLGVVPRARVAAQLQAMGRADRRRLAALGVRIGRESVFLPALLEPASARLRGVLRALHLRLTDGRGAYPAPGQRALSRALVFAPDEPADERLCAAWGYRLLRMHGRAPVALRADVLEQVADALAALARRARAAATETEECKGDFVATARLCRLAGCDWPALETVIRALGYRVGDRAEAGLTVAAPRRQRRRAPAARPNDAPARPTTRARHSDSPFAKLRHLSPGR